MLISNKVACSLVDWGIAMNVKKKNKLVSSKWKKLLLEDSSLIEQCNCWDVFDSWTWSQLLAVYPQLSDKCYKWDEMTKLAWANLLSQQPQFADKCKIWNKFSRMSWATLISAQPQFADRCDVWKIFNEKDFAKILSEQPQFADRCTIWKDFTNTEWLQLLCKQPQFAENFDEWGIFFPKDWKCLLMAQPQFADKCPYRYWNFHFPYPFVENLLKKYPDLWIYHRNTSFEKIKENSQNIEKSACVECFNSYQWIELLSIHPQLSPYCPFQKWYDFNANSWNNLIEKQPQFEEKAKEYLNGWCAILQTKPKLADECKCWEKFDIINWFALLRNQPQFMDRCPDNIYDEFDEEEWFQLEYEYPDIFSQKRLLSSLRKIANSNG